MPILKPFKLASREFHADDSVVEIKGVKIGGGHLAMIAGPCAIESEAILVEIAEAVRDGRGQHPPRRRVQAADQPLQLPGARRGRPEDPQATGERYGMPVVTEVMDPRQVELVERYADMFQIGARNMQNFDLLKEVGRTRTPVLLKRGMSATVKDLLMSAEYILAQGNRQRGPLRARRPDASRTRRATCSTCRPCPTSRGRATCRSSSTRATRPAGPT